MLFTTPSQFAVLALCLFAGWLFGLASASGGRRAKERLRALEAEHAAYRREAEGRIAAAEAERAQMARATPVSPVTTTAAASPAAASSARTGFFGADGDNLSRIHGIDEATERALAREGVKTYAAIEAITADQAARLEERLNIARGRIADERWREQAAALRQGREDQTRL